MGSKPEEWKTIGRAQVGKNDKYTMPKNRRSPLVSEKSSGRDSNPCSTQGTHSIQIFFCPRLDPSADCDEQAAPHILPGLDGKRCLPSGTHVCT